MTVSDPGFVWVCASCGRRVPRRLAECRCGARQETSALPDAPVPLPAEAPRALRPTGTAWPLVAAAFAAGLFVAVLLLRPAGSPAPLAAPAVPAAVAHGPGTEPDSFQTADAFETASSAPAGPIPFELPPDLRIETASPPAAVLVHGPPSSLEDVIGHALPAVVTVQAGPGRGSGFFVRPDTVVTNAHVVAGQSYVQVRLPGGEAVPARVALQSAASDLALLRLGVPRPGQATLPLGAAADVRVGQEVVAIGSPLGLLQNTVTRGIVSGMRRSGQVVLVQTDAAINPGNSGGPLIDRAGRAIGVTTLKVGARTEALGFAVAIDHLRSLLDGNPDPAAPVAAAPADPRLALLPPPRSAADVMREEGMTAFLRNVQILSRRADQVDDHWNRFKAACVTGPIRSGAYSREWFVLWEAAGSSIPVSPAVPQCAAALNDLRRMAGVIRAGMVEAQEAARRAAVYPGSLRDTRRQYRLDW